MQKRTIVIMLVALCFFIPISAWGQEIYDPLESFNRKIWWFNTTLDEYLLEPVARGYDKVVPSPVQVGVENFTRNLQAPAVVVSDIVQLDFLEALKDTMRFFVNSTIGIGGFLK